MKNSTYKNFFKVAQEEDYQKEKKELFEITKRKLRKEIRKLKRNENY